MFDPHYKSNICIVETSKQPNIYWCLPDASFMPGSVLSPLFVLAHLIYTSILGDDYYDFHYIYIYKLSHWEVR